MIIQFKVGTDVETKVEVEFIQTLQDNGFAVEYNKKDLSLIEVKVTQDDLLSISEMMNQFHEEMYIKTGEDAELK